MKGTMSEIDEIFTKINNLHPVLEYPEFERKLKTKFPDFNTNRYEVLNMIKSLDYHEQIDTIHSIVNSYRKEVKDAL